MPSSQTESESQRHKLDNANGGDPDLLGVSIAPQAEHLS